MKNFYWLVVIIIIASFLRLANLDSVPPGLYPDQAMNGNNAIEALRTGEFKVFYPENNGREGLFINLQAIPIALFGNVPWALRLPGALLGIFTVLGLYFLTKELFRESKLREEIALLGAFLLATSFWDIIFSRIGFRAIMAPFFLTWALYFLFWTFRKAAQEKLAPVKPALLSGIVYGLGFHSYIAYRATPILILFILWHYFRKAKAEGWHEEFWKITKYFSLAALIVFLPLGIYLFGHPQDFLGRTSQISVFSSQTPIPDLIGNTLKTLGMFNFIGDYNWRHNFSGRPELFWPVGIMFLAGVALLINQIRKLDFKFLVLTLWFAAASLPVIISNEGLPHALRAILLAPPVFIIAGLGGVWLYQYLKSKMPILKKQFRIMALLFLTLLAFEAYNTYFILWAKNPETAGAYNENYVKIAEKLNSLPKETPKVIIVTAGGVIVRGIPMPAQTVMFLTDTFREENQKEKNFYYLTPEKLSTFKTPESAYVVELN